MCDNGLGSGVWRGGTELQRFHGFPMPPGYLFTSRW
jgi:hypothetical protein